MSLTEYQMSAQREFIQSLSKLTDENEAHDQILDQQMQKLDQAKEALAQAEASVHEQIRKTAEIKKQNSIRWQVSHVAAYQREGECTEA